MLYNPLKLTPPQVWFKMGVKILYTPRHCFSLQMILSWLFKAVEWIKIVQILSKALQLIKNDPLVCI